MGVDGLGYMRGYCVDNAGASLADGSDIKLSFRLWGKGSVATAESSTMTEGSRPRVYDAVNSHGNPDLRQSAQGHLPVHLTFFLFLVLANPYIHAAQHVHAEFQQAHFLHRSQALLTLLLSRSSLLLFIGGDFGSSGLALAGVTVVTASIPLAGVHRAVDACFGSTPAEAT